MAQNKYISTKEAVRLTGLSTEEIYDLKGQRVTRTQMRKGVYIIGTKNKTYKIVVK